MLAERFLVRPLYGRGIDYPLLLTYGLGLILLDSVRILAGTEGIPFPAPDVLSGATDLGLFFFPTYRLFLIVVTALVLLALWFFLEKTPYGLIIRAGALDQEIVQVLGVDVARVWLIVFGAGVALAGLAGVLAAPIRGVFPEMGIPILVDAFVVTVIGGMGSLLGAVVAGLLVGVTVSFTSLLLPADRDAVDLHPHGAGADLPAAGSLRPRRGARLMAAGAQAAGGTEWRLRAAPLIGMIARHRVLAAVIFLAVFPWLAPYKALAVNILIFGLFAMGFNLIYGYAGMLSFGHAALFGLGAYGCGVADREVRRAVVHRPAARRRHRRPRLGGDRLVRDALARHLLRDGDARLVAGRLLRRLPVGVADRRRERPARRQRAGDRRLRRASQHRRPDGEVLSHPGDRRRRDVGFLAHPRLAVRRRHGGDPRERAPRRRLRLRRQPHALARLHPLGLFSGLAGALCAIHLSIVPIETLHYFTSAVVLMMTLLGGMGTFFGPFLGALRVSPAAGRGDGRGPCIGSSSSGRSSCS